MEFEDNNQIQKSDNTLTNVILIALGAAILFFLFKGNQAQQPQVTSQAQYNNDEQWHIQRGNDGFIEDLRVGRHANVGNGNIVSSPGNYKIDNYKTEYGTYSTESNLIDREQLSKYIKELVNKNVSERINMNYLDTDRIMYSDSERRRRFRMS